MITPMHPDETQPETGGRCPRCHRTASRSDGIPCELCSPYGPTTIDEREVTHHWGSNACWCGPHTTRTFFPVVSASPVDCMTCIVRAARRP